MAKNTIATPANPDPMLSKNQVAEYTGLSLRTVDRQIAEGRLTPLRFGRVVRFRLSDVEAWINGGRA